MSFLCHRFSLSPDPLSPSLSPSLAPLSLSTPLPTHPRYAYVLLISSLVSTAAVAALPVLERNFGRFRLAAVAFTAGSITAATAFSLQSTGQLWGVLLHVTLAVVLFGALALLEPSLKTIASLYVSENLQGRSFGVLATLSSIGAMAGSISGT